MHLPQRCISAGSFVLNYGATNLAPSQKDQSPLSSKRRSHLKTCKWSWNEQKFGHGSQGGSKPRTTLLAKASRNILDLDLYLIQH
jgi:hypothetical protein